jgi:hypothetical protein
MADRAAHLSDEQLSRFRDGDLPRAESQHLETCAHCGKRLRDLDNTVAAYAHYRDAIRAPLLPQPPSPWRSLDQMIAQHESKRRRIAFWGFWMPALAASCAALWLLAIMPRIASQSSGRATDLLTRASHVQLAEGRQIVLRAHGRVLRRPAILRTERRVDDPDLAHLQTLFHAANYSWREPLSSVSFQSWRGTLKRKNDSVTVVHPAGAPDLYRVRTEAPEGVLRSASLTLRAADLHPTGGGFEFAGEDPLDMQEVVAAPQESSLAESASAPHAPVARESAPETPATPEDTLRVLAALDEIGADAGDPIDVSFDPSHQKILVRANGLSPERKKEVAEALHLLPRVTLDLDSAAPLAIPAHLAEPEVSSSSIPAPVRQRLESRLGGAVAVQEATDVSLDAAASILTRAHALETLARGFPPQIEAHLHSEGRAVLQRLRQHHAAELQKSLVRIRAALRPLLDPADAPHPQMPENREGAAWQSEVPAALAAARNTDQLLNRLLAGSYAPSAGEEMLHDLGPALQRLDWSIQPLANPK